jgi:hypothetical protein
MFSKLLHLVLKIFHDYVISLRTTHTHTCWILSWAVTLEISARRRSDKPAKNL